MIYILLVYIYIGCHFPCDLIVGLIYVIFHDPNCKHVSTRSTEKWDRITKNSLDKKLHIVQLN